MKLRLAILIALVATLSVNLSHAQPGIPYKTGGSVLFGKDVVMSDVTTENQRNISICSAFNGWLYACFWTPEPVGFSYSILRSTDNGINWTRIKRIPQTFTANLFITKMEIIACGSDDSSIKIFLGFIIYHPESVWGQALVSRFDGITGDFEEEILDDQFSYTHDLALASDVMFPAVNSTPNSIAVLYSKAESLSGEEKLVFCSSSNGGISFDSTQEIRASQTLHFSEVDLAYGRCHSKNNGTYFASWVEKGAWTDSLGHIYTSHTTPYFNSHFTAPFCLDSLDPGSINKCRRPVISCQVNDLDNDSSDITQITLFYKFDIITGTHAIKGYYNKEASQTGQFMELSFINPNHLCVQPDICFNTSTSSFMVTYYDSTDRKLPFLTKDFNLVNPNTWTVASPGYNDSNNMTNPYPKVGYNNEQQDGMNVWISDRVVGNGEAMFDSPYSTYTGASTISYTGGIRLLGVSPNPCKSTVEIGFELPMAEYVTITISSITGKPMKCVTDQIYSSGKHQVSADISGLPQGIYLYTFKAGGFVGSGKMAIVR